MARLSQFIPSQPNLAPHILLKDTHIQPCDFEIPASQLQAKVGVWNYSQQDLDRAVHYAINKRELPEFEARHANGKVTTNA